MTLTFVVRNQTLMYIDTKVIPRIGSAKYLELKFKFVTKDWIGLRKTLHISAGEYSEPFILESDTFQVPPYYTQQPTFTVTLLGDNDAGVVVPTNEVTMSLDESNTLWTAVPPDPQNSAYLELFKSIVPSDWAQNDPSAKDYVKNRTHYVSRESRVLVPEQEVTAVENGGVDVAVISGVDSDALKTLYNSKDDTTFDVVFDGASYQCKWFEQDGPRMPFFGNFAMFNPSVTDTGEPFCVGAKTPDGDGPWRIFCKVAGTHTVAVSYKQDVVHTLDPKYIKDMYHAEMRESKVGTAMRGWWNVTSGGSNPVIPKMSVGGVVYENLSPSKVEGIDYYYAVGDYTFRFHAAQGEQYRYLAIDPRYEGDYDEIVFYALIEDVTAIPEKYMPDFVRNGSLVSLVTAVDPEHSTIINARGVDRNTLVVFMVMVGQSIAVQSSIIDSSGTEYPIYSARTGAKISDAERPRGVMLLKYASDRWWCINTV